jgi:hypothetical protein
MKSAFTAVARLVPRLNRERNQRLRSTEGVRNDTRIECCQREYEREKGGCMFRRAAVDVAILLLILLVGSAVAQTLSGNQLVVTGSGPNSVGGLPDAQVHLNLYGSFAPASGTAQGFRMGDKLFPGPGGDAYGFNIIPTLNRASSGTHTNFVGMQVQPPVIAGGAAGLTNAATVWITGAPSAATNNYALLVGGLFRVTGNAQIDGNIAAKYQDVAEWVKTDRSLPGGTVVVIDQGESNRVSASKIAYDQKVAGVVSAMPGILLGEGGANKAKVAHSGRVKVRVDARYGAISVGDLLVTSDTPGHAMRSTPVEIGGAEIHRPGTLIGKALEALPSGVGEILVLLTLQ